MFAVLMNCEKSTFRNERKKHFNFLRSLYKQPLQTAFTNSLYKQPLQTAFTNSLYKQPLQTAFTNKP
jgi:hypothetical protein